MLQLVGTEHYLEAALRLLQFLEARRPTGRRFGADADARWNSFRGDLATADRIELMIRDADAEWPGALGARTVYSLGGVPEDEPFGSQWEGADPVAAEELWRRLKKLPAPATPQGTLEAIAGAWDLAVAPYDVGVVKDTDQLVIAGASAIVAAVLAFVDGAALDWSAQVIVVASRPGERQLAAAAAAILNARATARIVQPGTSVRAGKGARLVVSPDARREDRDHATTLVGA